MFKQLLLDSKYSLTSMFLVLAISAMFVSLAYWYWSSAHEEKQNESKRLQNIVSKYELARTNADLLTRYKGRYIELKKKKLIESDDRLNWVIAIENAVKRKLITAVQYKIDEQRKINNGRILASFPDIDIYRSRMTLDMSLLHEGDLYAFFKELDIKAHGLFEIKSCEINGAYPSSKDLLNSVNDTNLKAKCLLDWYNIKSRGT